MQKIIGMCIYVRFNYEDHSYCHVPVIHKGKDYWFGTLLEEASIYSERTLGRAVTFALSHDNVVDVQIKRYIYEEL